MFFDDQEPALVPRHQRRLELFITRGSSPELGLLLVGLRHAR
ncbi:hypothetical protein [Lapillicoccus sp.]